MPGASAPGITASGVRLARRHRSERHSHPRGHRPAEPRNHVEGEPPVVEPNAQPLYEARTFWELLDQRADATPDLPMLLDGSDRRVTFGEFRSWVERVAAGFHAMGIREGSHVTW